MKRTMSDTFPFHNNNLKTFKKQMYEIYYETILHLCQKQKQLSFLWF